MRQPCVPAQLTPEPAPHAVIIDFHTHILPPSFSVRQDEIAQRDATFNALFGPDAARHMAGRNRKTIAAAEELVAAMDEDSIDISVALGYGWTNPSIAREANNYILDAAARYPNRIIPFCSVNPAWGDDAIAEIERCASNGARGVGELHSTTQRLNLRSGTAIDPVAQLASDKKLPIVVHGSDPLGRNFPGKGDATPERLLALAQRFPNTTFVFAHWGGGLPFYSLMPEVRAALANVYFDSAASPFLYDAAVFSVAASAAGPSRILLGSDYPLLPPRRLAEQARATLPPPDADAALGGNAANLLRLAPHFP